MLSAEKACAYKSQEGTWQKNQIQNLKLSFSFPEAILYKSATQARTDCIPLPGNLLSNLTELLPNNAWP